MSESWGESDQPLSVEEVQSEASQDWGANDQPLSPQEVKGAVQQHGMLEVAREDLGQSWFPGTKATLLPLGNSLLSLYQRAAGEGEAADATNRWSGAYQAAKAGTDEGAAFLKRGLRGTIQSLPPALIGGRVAGPYGAIGVAAAMEAEQAITEGRDVGKSGADLAKYAARQGIAEAVPAAVMQKIGLGGLEKILGGGAKEFAKVGVKEAIKRAGVDVSSELFEEIATEVWHNAERKLAGVDPNALSADSLQQTVLDTTTQTLMTMGLVEGMRAGVGVANQKAENQIQKQQQAARQYADYYNQANRQGEAESVARQQAELDAQAAEQAKESFRNRMDELQDQVSATQQSRAEAQAPVEQRPFLPAAREKQAQLQAQREAEAQRQAAAEAQRQQIQQTAGQRQGQLAEQRKNLPPENPQEDPWTVQELLRDGWQPVNGANIPPEVMGHPDIQFTETPAGTMYRFGKQNLPPAQPEVAQFPNPAALKTAYMKAVGKTPNPPWVTWVSGQLSAGKSFAGVLNEAKGPGARRFGKTGGVQDTQAPVQKTPPPVAPAPTTQGTQDDTRPTQASIRPPEVQRPQGQKSQQETGQGQEGQADAPATDAGQPGGNGQVPAAANDAAADANAPADAAGSGDGRDDVGPTPDGKMRSLSGRVFDPPSQRSTQTNQGVKKNVLAVDTWLVEQGREEARAKGDQWNLDQFDRIDPAKITPAERDGLNLYLFGQEDVALPPQQPTAPKKRFGKPLEKQPQVADIPSQESTGKPEPDTMSGNGPAKKLSLDDFSEDDLVKWGEQDYYAKRGQNAPEATQEAPKAEDSPKPKRLGKPQQTPPAAPQAPSKQESHPYKDILTDWLKDMGRDDWLGMTGKRGELNKDYTPKAVNATMKMVARMVKQGVKDFGQLVRSLVEFLDPERVREIGPLLEDRWEAVRNAFDIEGMSEAGSVLDLVPEEKTDKLADNSPEAKSEDTIGTEEEQDNDTEKTGRTPGTGGKRAEPVDEEPAEGSPGSRGERDAPGGTGDGGGVLGGHGQATDGTGDAAGAGVPGSGPGVGGDTGHRRDSGGSPGNFVLKDGETVGGGDSFRKKQRYRDNLAALRLLKRLEEEGRYANEEEQQILAKYVGWGGLKEVFKENVSDDWRKEKDELRALLTDDEYKSVRRSIQNAHYTDPNVYRAIWDGLLGFGFSGGKITEPAMGSGIAFATMPGVIRVSRNTSLHGIELDSLTGRLARHLFPDASVQVSGFEAVNIPDNSVDLFISNVPFARVKIYDKHDQGLQRGPSIHDFFFEKALKKTRPGGLVAFITSKDSLDEVSSADRKAWQDMGGDLIGAIRLPGGQFKGTADTSVVTDILFFQKRQPGAIPGGQPFMRRGELRQQGYWGFPEEGRKKQWINEETTFPVNEYFVKHPDHVIGDLAWTGTMRQKGTFNVEPNDADTPTRIREIMQAISDNVDKVALEGIQTQTEDLQNRQADALDTKEWPHDWIKVEGDRIYINENGTKTEIPAPKLRHVKDKAGKIIEIKSSPNAAQRYKGLIDVFEAAEKLVALQASPKARDAEVEAARFYLNHTYDRYTKKNGPLSETDNQTYAKRSLTMLSRLLSLEHYDPTENTAEKAAIFRERTERPRMTKDRADTPEEALRMALAYKGRPDVEYMAKVTGKTTDQVLDELGDHLFENPETGTHELAATYLSGPVRAKLTVAREAAANDKKFERNVKALEAAQPADLPPSKIYVRLGSPWIPESDYRDFVEHLIAKEVYLRRVPTDNTWLVQSDSRLRLTERETVDWGTEDRPALELIEKYLNNHEDSIRVFRRTPKPDNQKYEDTRATALARAKLEAIKTEFVRWLWADQARSERLLRHYNDTYNDTVGTEYDGKHLEFPGMSEEWRRRFDDHQRNAVWRYLLTGNMLLGHVVGAGKTATMAAMAMEAKRLSGNPSYKTLLTVPNHLITSGQALKEILDVYPSAKVLAATPDMLSGKGRRTLLKRIATENYDMVVMAHTSFTKTPLDPEFEREFIQKQVDALEEEIRRAHDEKDPNYEAELEAQKQNLESKLAHLIDQADRDVNSVYFDQLGIDSLFVDEAHEFKNLQVRTRMSRVPGVSTSFSSRAFDMHMKTTFFNQATNHRGVVLATGTPIANALGELFVMQQYLQPQVLEKLNLNSFDAWAAAFASTVTKPEIDPAGGGMRMHSRLGQYVNLPDLMGLFRQVADIKTGKHLDKILGRPKVSKGGAQKIEIERNPFLEVYIEELQHRAAMVRAGQVDPSDDNMLKICGDGRKAALDMRLIDPSLPDLAGSKMNVAVGKIHQVWEATHDRLGTQLVWVDVTSPNSDKAGGFNFYREMVEKLVAKGIPREQIAVMHDFDEKTKGGMFARMNKGQIRVLMGSTPVMGTGVNVQKRLIAAHHLDAPFRPDQVEQRDGRQVRRGNDNKEVHIFRYLSKGSFDAYMWQLLENKSEFIRQALSGDANMRTASAADESDLSAAEMKAAAQDDPNLTKYVEADARVRQLEAEYGGFVDEQSSMRRKIESEKWSVRHYTEQADRYKSASDEYRARVAQYPDGEIRASLSPTKMPKVKSETKDGEPIPDEITEQPSEPRQFTTKKEFSEALLKALQDATSNLNVDETARIPIEFNGLRGAAEATKREFEGVTSGKFDFTLRDDAHNIALYRDLGDNAAGNIQRIENAIEQQMLGREDEFRKDAEKAGLVRKQLEQRVGRQWTKTEELERARTERHEYFNLVNNTQGIQEEVAKRLTRSTGRQVEPTEDGSAYLFTNNGQRVPDDDVQWALDRMRDEQRQERLQKLNEAKRNVDVYQWERPEAPPPKPRRFSKKRGGGNASVSLDQPRRFDDINRQLSEADVDEAIPDRLSENRPGRFGGQPGSDAAPAEQGYGLVTVNGRKIDPASKPPAKPEASPEAKEALRVKDVSSTLDGILKIVAPTQRGGRAEEGAQLFREAFAWKDQKLAAINAQLAKLRPALWMLGYDADVDLMDRIEKGEAQPNAKLQHVADGFRKILDTLRDEVRALGEGHLENFNKNYFPHIWTRPEQAEAVMSAIMGRRPLEGSKAFLKKRTIPTIREGIEEHGLEPLSYNPADLVFAKATEMVRYLMAQKIIRDTKAAGLAKFLYWKKKLPKGWEYVNDPLMTVYGSPEIKIKEAYDALLVDQLMDFARSLGIDAQRVLNMRGHKWGEARGTDEVTTRFGGPESVLIHEIGHILGNRYGLFDWMQGEKRVNAKGKMEFVDKDKGDVRDRVQINKEMRALADLRYQDREASDSYKSYVRNQAEKEAVMLEAYIHAPKKFKETAPMLYKAFTKFLGDHAELRTLLDVEPSLVLASGEAKVPVPGLQTLGHWIMPEEVALLLNNHLSPGLWGSKNEFVRKGYEFVRQVSNTLNQVQLSASAFHGLFTSISVPISYMGQGMRNMLTLDPKMWARGAVEFGAGALAPLALGANLWRGHQLIKAYRTDLDQIRDPRMRNMVEAMIKGGGGGEMDRYYNNNARAHLRKTLGTIFKDPSWVKKSKGAAKLPVNLASATLESMMYPILNWLVPRQKLGMFALMAGDEMKRMGTQDVGDAVMRRQLTAAWDSVDNRLGQLRYDNLFWNRTFKDTLMAGVRSVGWNMGFLREYIYGGTKDVLTTYGRVKGGDALLSFRSAELFATTVVLGILGAVIHKALTGDDPDEPKDYFFPRTGKNRPDGSPERLSLPTYSKDLYSWTQDPMRTAAHKAHPVIAMIAQTVDNKDYYGTEIYHKDDPFVQQFQDLAQYVGEQFLPFSVRNWQELRKDDTPAWQAALTASTGVGVAPAYVSKSRAQLLMDQYNADSMPKGSRTKEQAAKSEIKRKIADKLRAGQDLEESDWQGKLSPGELQETARKANLHPLERSFSRLSIENALNVYNIATDKERDILSVPLTIKYQNAMQSVESGSTHLTPDKIEAVQKMFELLLDDVTARNRKK